jgi:hypothetical protein
VAKYQAIFISRKTAISLPALLPIFTNQEQKGLAFTLRLPAKRAVFPKKKQTDRAIPVRLFFI